MTELKEFIDENEADARAKALQHYGVSPEALDAKLVPSDLDIANLAGRVILLARVREAAPAQVGPVSEFVLELVQKMGIGGSPSVDERTSSGQLNVRVDSAELAALARETSGLMASIGHLAERKAQRAGDDEITVRVDLAGAPSGRERSGRDRDGGGRGRERGERGARGGRERGGRERGGRDRGERPGRERSDRQRPDARHSNDGGSRAESGGDTPENPALERLARESGERVRDTGEPATLEPMNSRERWIVHNALKEVGGIASESVGDGRLKQVKIFPA